MTIRLREIILLMIIVSIIIIICFVADKKNKQKQYMDDLRNFSIVTDNSSFYDVEGIVTKYVELINSDDRDSLLKILDKNYIKENHVDKKNIMKLLPKLKKSSYTFKSSEMYYYNDNESITRYLVKGNIMENSLNKEIKKDTLYVVVILNHKKELFSIIPDDGTIFEGGSK